jgi:hypothetical protein
MGEIITTTATCFELHFWLGLGLFFTSTSKHTNFILKKQKTNKQTKSRKSKDLWLEIFESQFTLLFKLNLQVLNEVKRDSGNKFSQFYFIIVSLDSFHLNQNESSKGFNNK